MSDIHDQSQGDGAGDERNPVSTGPETYPVLPLRDIVVFPHMIVPLFVGREKSVRALEAVMQSERQILLATQKNAGDDEPTADDIHTVGVVANVLQLLKLPDGTVKVLVEGKGRARLHLRIHRPRGRLFRGRGRRALRGRAGRGTSQAERHRCAPSRRAVRETM